MTNTSHKTTKELLSILRSTHSVSELKEYTENLSVDNSFHNFSEYLCSIIRERNIIESDLIRDSLIQRTYAYQILNGTKNPGRDKVLAENFTLYQQATRLDSLGFQTHLSGDS